MIEAAPWSAVRALPAPVQLSTDYDRHAPSDEALRRQLFALAASRPWPELGWVELADALVSMGRTDVPLSRLVEGHVDALRILNQAHSQPVPDALYGVWASRSQQTGAQATRRGSALVLSGTIRFASGLGVLDRALLPLWTEPEHHLLIDLDLSTVGTPQLVPDTHQWSTAAMEVSRSHTLVVDGLSVPASTQVGELDFYLDRPGFFPGGVGVAACWLGGATRVADLVRARLRSPLPAALQLRLGAMRACLCTGAAALRAGSHRLRDELDLPQGRAVAAETRWAVAAAVHGVLEEAHRMAGPAGLAYDRDLTRAVHDLQIYVLQHNVDAEATYLATMQPW